MKKLLTAIILINCVKANAQTANAGSNHDIYLSQQTSDTLTGSGTGSGITYLWSDISTDYTSGLSIASPTNATTRITGLKQGTFYFKLTVTDASSQSKSDTVVLNVYNNMPPAGSTLLRQLIIPDMSASANLRDDTTTNFQPGDEVSPFPHTEGGIQPNRFYYIRDRMNGAHVDSAQGKYYSTIEDGWGGVDSYTKSELFLRNDYNFPIDTTSIYMFEWKGYFPDPPTINYSDLFTVIFQLHASDAVSPPFQFAITHDSLCFGENWGDGNGQNGLITRTGFPFFGLMAANDFYKNSHTIRIEVKEGKGFPGQTSFIKIFIDGVQKYYRNDGQVGQTLTTDYPRFATVYDFDNVMVDAANHTRGKKFSLTTESFKIYNLASATIAPDPTPVQPTYNTIELYGNYKITN